MAESNQTAEVRVNESAGHLSFHVEGAHPVDVPFLFEQPQKRIAPAFAGSLITHLLLGLVVVLMVRYGSGSTTSDAVLPDQPKSHIIWLSQTGPGGGGGGGGTRHVWQSCRARTKLPSLSTSHPSSRCSRSRKNLILWLS